MAGKKKYDPFGLSPEPQEPAVAVADAPAPADPQPNGDQPIHQPPPVKRRKKRDPLAPRPWYQIQAYHPTTGVIRVLLIAPTIGQARKKLTDAVQFVGGGVEKIYIVRCKEVA